MIEVGEFNVTSSQVIVSDPSYEKDSSGLNIFGNVRNGIWVAKILCYYSKMYESNLVSELVVYNKDTIDEGRLDFLEWVNSEEHILVDSGMVGVYDLKYYPEKTTDKYDGGFYDRVCNSIKSLTGMIDNLGVTTSSGYGDGRYNCFHLIENGNVVAIKVVFIDDSNVEEDLKNVS